ncbi:Nif3-like dinuclear metal center hexameric protein [Oceanobacillus halotolerans]|uniref:Nif3-like dinuclear metal center hexameric protein n=1 Tax=Oceanobacillus halotolerans TaxID=2663380 RepID=UPI0013DD1AE7|nr:Nif3-like dinuclear metal center hexameric protein [Oceanobacillus halotolerans]
MSKEVRSGDIFQLIEKWAPKHFAYDWDNVGLQVGSYNKHVNKVMITLDVTEKIVDEAIQAKVDVIIAHHPLLFKPLKQMNVHTPQGRILRKLLQHDITVYAAHTNLDIASGGVNDMLARTLGIESTEVLVETHVENLFKISVFVPTSHADAVQNALGKAGAGFIGNYSHCTFQTEGQGTFMPQEGTDPFIGAKNELARVDEIKIETIIPEDKLSTVIKEMVKAHPYEEAAYDIYPLANKGKRHGLGRIGSLNQTITLRAFCEEIKERLDINHLRVTGDLDQQVQKIAVLGGSGEKYFSKAYQKGADVYITGDMTFHSAQDAWNLGISVVDPGHHIEKVMKQGVKEYLDEHFGEVDVLVSEIDTDPFQFM